MVQIGENMEIKKIVSPGMDQNAYILSSGGEGIIVDAGGSAEKIIEAVKDIKIKCILLTHGHFDHVLAVNEVKKALSCPVWISKGDAAMLSDHALSFGDMYGVTYDKIEYEKELSEGDVISFGAAKLSCMETPGHSPGSMCYFGGGILISGDMIFKGTIGRFEFPDRMDMSNSLEKLWRLPESTIVYPGHGEITTIGYELQYNPYVGMKY